MPFQTEDTTVSSGETTPLLFSGGGDGRIVHQSTLQQSMPTSTTSIQESVYTFLEARGTLYAQCMTLLIVMNVVAFVMGTLVVAPDDNSDDEEEEAALWVCDTLCDTVWLGKDDHNYFAILQLGRSTSLLELVTMVVFTVDYLLRVWTCPCADVARYGAGPSSSWVGSVTGRLYYIGTNFFALVDLVSILPFYLDVLFVSRSTTSSPTGTTTTAFVRMFRLFRLLREDGGKYDNALTLCDDVVRAQWSILGTATFVGGTVWIGISALYYLVERHNPAMIYCPLHNCGEVRDEDAEVDTSLCEMDPWGLVDCTAAGCPPTAAVPEPCWNLYQSIPMASYYSLLNLFGEFPLFTQHSVGGQVVGTLTAVVAAAVFGLPVGIIGSGFETEIAKRRTQKKNHAETTTNEEEEDGRIVERGVYTTGHISSGHGFRSTVYNFCFPMTTPWSIIFDTYVINTLVVGTAVTFMMDTIDLLPTPYRIFQSYFEFGAAILFTIEYLFKLYGVMIDPMYTYSSSSSSGSRSNSILSYMTGFLPLVDVLAFLPYWIYILGGGGAIVDVSGPSNIGGTFVKALRLLRIFRFEKYTHAFTSFDNIFWRYADVLSVTLFSAVIVWIFFGGVLYITERNNPDPEMAENYSTVPNSMWMTLLNLSGEAPLAQYSVWGKIATGFLGLFATALFGIPIGILGAGFEEVVEEETEDEDCESTTNLFAPISSGEKSAVLATAGRSGSATVTDTEIQYYGTNFERVCYNTVNGVGSAFAHAVETGIYILIFLIIAIGALQTVKGHEDDFSHVESIVVVIFTLEYLIRLIGIGADPEYVSSGQNGVIARIRYVISFYSIIDLFAILPYYIALLLPSSIVDQYDEYLRMTRIIRLLKLDKYAPSFTLIDDVIRYKKNSLKVAGYAAITLWICFAGLLYLFEYTDSNNDIDPVPLYGCIQDCTMMDRFRNYFDSFFYTGIHLTGDYPITTYDWPAKFVNFFMVIAATGVVSVPSGLIAGGFMDVVNSKKRKAKKARENNDATLHPDAVEGDDWYEEQYRALEGIDPPLSRWGPTMDKYQLAVNEFLNGTKDPATGHTTYTHFALFGRVFIFTVIIGNILAVLIESIPQIDKAVGNDPGNFFDTFEAFSIAVFTLEYISRLFCAPKNREALYSSRVYAQTFFGIVDLLSTLPWYVELVLVSAGTISTGGDAAMVFRIFRIFRILQLEDFVTAFSKLDNVFRASSDVLKATGLLALIIWVGGGSLFFIFEQNNPNFRECDESIPLVSNTTVPGCYDFSSTDECNDYYPGMCDQKVFVNLPNTLYMVAVFLGGEWGVTDFTPAGRVLCILFCYVGIALYAIPAGILFDKFGAVLGLSDDDDDDEDEE